MASASSTSQDLRFGDAAPEDTRGRIIQAALRQCEQVGLRRTTMEDVAKRAGLARVTIYRHFPSKDALVYAVILSELNRFFAALDAAVAGFLRPDERLIEGFVFALGFVREHALLNRLLRTEPEALLVYLVTDSPLMVTARGAVAEKLRTELAAFEAQEQDVTAIAEVAVRLVLSMALSPASVLELESPEGARRFARRYLVPGLHLRAGCG